MNPLLPDTQTVSYPHRSVRQIMMHVMLALLPGTVLMAWLIDARVLLILFTAISGGLVAEALLLQLRGKALRTSLGDGSIIVATWLLGLCVPPSLPLWQLLVGVFVLSALGKHLYGGLGHNPFNPAMVAYAVLLVSFPVTMTDWQSGVADGPATQSRAAWDALSGATPLDALRQLRLVDSESAFINTNEHYAQTAGALIMSSHWKWLSLSWLAGGLYLLMMRIISWHIPLAVLSSLSLLYAGLALLSNGQILPVFPALLSGAVMLGAFFIATDPVTAAASRTGKLIYGAGIGILCVFIREYSSYPEGFAFAILLMNTAVPLIDYLLTGPAGHKRRSTS